MADPKITVAVGARKVPIDEVRDTRITTAFRAAARDVGTKLSAIKCPVHAKVATNVRLHFERNGGVDLQYDSCCAELGKKIGAELG
jgi:hypothetical protein